MRGALPAGGVDSAFSLPPALQQWWAEHLLAKVAELVDALDLGSSAARRGGSSPPFRTIPFPALAGTMTMGTSRIPGDGGMLPWCAFTAAPGPRWRRWPLSAKLQGCGGMRVNDPAF